MPADWRAFYHRHVGTSYILMETANGQALVDANALFMTLMAGLQVLLARYSGQQDLVVGTVIANRTPPETEALIGFFLNSLAMRGE